MKIMPRQIDSFVQKPDAHLRAILVYGPDEGKMRERASIISRTIVKDLNDPFNAALLNAAILSDDPARLSDEANAMSMMGGARLIKIENAADSLTTLMKAYLADPSPVNLVVLEGGDLGTRSSLRKLFETAPNAAAVPCYLANAGEIQALIRKTVQISGYAIDPDACSWLAQQLIGDHAIAMNELEKLTLYMAHTPTGTRIGLHDVQACCGLGGDKSVDDLVYATAGGNPDLALRSYRQLSAEGMVPIVIHRALQNHFRRLHLTRSLMEQGMGQAEAIGSLNPKIFFKWEDAFREQVGRWSMGALESTLNRLAKLEAESKQTGTPVETLTAQAILSLSAKR